MTTVEPLVLRVRQVAALLQVSRPIVYEMCKDGRLQSISVGRSIRIPRSAVEAFIADQSS